LPILLNISGYRKQFSNIFDMNYYNVFLRAVRSIDISLLYKYFAFRSVSQAYLYLRSNMRFYFILALFFYSILKFSKIVNSAHVLSFGSTGLLRDIIFNKYLAPMFQCLKVRLHKYFRVCLPIAFRLSIMLFSNYQINATFLSRYIAKKLEYHHRLRHILYPLKREFKRLGAFTKSSTIINNDKFDMIKIY